MRTSEMIKSKFWRAGDLQGQAPVILTIAHVTEELMGRGARQDVKCFLWFSDHIKGLQLNKTRVRTLEAAYGPDSDLWTGKRVRLSFDPTVEFGGRAVGGVRLQTPPGIVYSGSPAAAGAWGTPPAGAPGRPPAPVWDEQRQTWILPQPPAISAAPVPFTRPPAPVWNEATQSWDTVDRSTGEISPVTAPAGPEHTRAPTISERVAAGSARDQDWTSGATSPTAEFTEFNDDIPF